MRSIIGVHQATQDAIASAARPERARPNPERARRPGIAQNQAGEIVGKRHRAVEVAQLRGVTCATMARGFIR